MSTASTPAVNEELSENARRLLGLLNLLGGEIYSCIAFSWGLAKPYVIIPSPNFNWDTRVKTPDVLHPEAILELVRLGYMELKEFPIKFGIVNKVYQGLCTDRSRSAQRCRAYPYPTHFQTFLNQAVPFAYASRTAFCLLF